MLTEPKLMLAKKHSTKRIDKIRNVYVGFFVVIPKHEESHISGKDKLKKTLRFTLKVIISKV